MAEIPVKSFVVYKNKPALVIEQGERLRIRLPNQDELKVREKDITFLYPGPVENFSGLEKEPPRITSLEEAWELLQEETVSLLELAELLYGTISATTVWHSYLHVQEHLYFEGEPTAITPRRKEVIEQEITKRKEREQEEQERKAFLDRLRTGKLKLPEDGRFIQDVVALALGKTDKSKTLRELGKKEDPLVAHKLLLTSGYWDEFENPHPSRSGCPLNEPRSIPEPPPPSESRKDLTHLPAFAIDNPWSHDPDDAVYMEGKTLYVHIADPACTIPPDGTCDEEARERGTTLYLPEGTIPMLHPLAVHYYGLGLQPLSPALTIQITLSDDGEIEETHVYPSLVRVERLTYEQADTRSKSPELAPLFAFAQKNIQRREDSGAVTIEFPEIHLTVRDRHVHFEPIQPTQAALMVRECMLIAGEAVARWALRNQIPFPFIAQEIGDKPTDIPSGLAGSYQLRRCMRPRRLSTQPGSHEGLGLSLYTQVTSPLRRYTDLVAHQQIRRVLRGDSPLSGEEILKRIAAGEAAALAATQAERASRLHWTLVYLKDKIESPWEGTILDIQKNRALVLIPSLALETQVSIKTKRELNETITLLLKKVHIPEGEALFIEA
ncbi:MAG: RNB domain-containing ribonuclease [Treponemataceae bacterium]|nr:RNB domain-containing ribonuclease [Treponemataceae bacterium]